MNKTMHQPKSRAANVHVGTIEASPRGPLLRDDEGVVWRLGFVDDQVPEDLVGRVTIRGRVVDLDRIEVEYWERLDGGG